MKAVKVIWEIIVFGARGVNFVKTYFHQFLSQKDAV